MNNKHKHLHFELKLLFHRCLYCIRWCAGAVCDRTPAAPVRGVTHYSQLPAEIMPKLSCARPGSSSRGRTDVHIPRKGNTFQLL